LDIHLMSVPSIANVNELCKLSNRFIEV